MIKYLEKDSDFDTLVKPKVLVDFYADWCGPCKMMGALLEDMEEELGLDVVKINTDKFPEIAVKFGVMSIPTLLLMENGNVLKKSIGYMDEDETMTFIQGE